MLSVRNLVKTYKLGKKKNSKKVVALNNVSLDFPDKGLVFLLGKSGSGKSTLLNAIGGLDTFDSGEIIIKGKSSKDFKQSDFDSYRNTFIGFIFQEYNILEEFTVGKNLSLALELQGKKAEKEDVEALLEQVDLQDYYKRKPNQLSGGQKQRVAIARALIKDPEIIMADEPTGALDSNTGKQVMDTLKKLSEKKLVIIVSHDREFAEIYGDRVIELKDGKIIKDETKGVKIAQKTESGVSFIGDKIIHIKKGQQLTQADLLAINKMIIAKAQKEETIISFDDDTNETVKKVAFITDEGNREVFEKTQPEDIKRKNHDPKDFKLIKSKLKMSDAFKIGTSSLKHKPIRLIFTVLLASIAFCLFGLVDTLGSFNQARSIYESMQEMNLKNVAVSKTYLEADYDSDMGMTDADLKVLEDQNEMNFQPVVASGAYWNFDNGYINESSAQKHNLLCGTRLSGIMEIKENTLSNYNLQLIHGRLPQTYVPVDQYDRVIGEVCISKLMLETLIHGSDNVESWADVEGKNIYGSAGNSGNQYFKVVGVIQDDTDISKYANVQQQEGGSSIANMINDETTRTVIEYGLVNMIYTTEDVFDVVSNNFFNDNSYYTVKYGTGDNESSTSFGGYNFYDINDDAYSYIRDTAVLVNGKNFDNLAENDIIIGDNNYQYFDCFDEDALQSKIMEGGLKLQLYKGWNSKEPIFELNIVGYITESSSFYCNKETKAKLFGGYSYAIARMTNSSVDKDFVEFVSDYDNNKMGFKIQFESTPIFDNFGGMIEDLAKPFLYVGLGLAVFAGFMLMNFISTSISYKKREIGVLRAIGARGKDVFAMFFSESFVICLINFLISAIGCGVAAHFIGQTIINKLGFTISVFSFGIRQVALLFGVSLLVAFIASFFPVYKIAKKNPIDSINNR